MPYPIPNPAAIYQPQQPSQWPNAIANIMGMKEQRQQNTLAETRTREEQRYKRGREEKKTDTANKIKALNLMTKAPNKAIADNYWKMIMGEDAGDPPKVHTTGDTIEIKGFTTSGGKKIDIKGPRTVIADYLDAMEKNPERADDPEASRTDMAFMARQGVSFGFQKEDKGTGLKQTIDELNALPEGSPRRKFYEGKLAKMTTPTGMKVRFNAETGDFEMTMGGPLGESGLGKKAQGEIEKKLIDTTAQMSRLKAIENAVDPSFLTAGSQLNNWFLSKKEWLGFNLSAKNKAFVSRVKKFRMATFRNLNRYVKEITGAQMSELEVHRIKESIPKMEDSPTQFMTALSESLRLGRMSVMRLNYIQHHGLELKGDKLKTLTSLDNLPKFMDNKGEQYEAAMRRQNPQMSEDEIFESVKQQLADEFGLVN